LASRNDLRGSPRQRVRALTFNDPVPGSERELVLETLPHGVIGPRLPEISIICELVVHFRRRHATSKVEPTLDIPSGCQLWLTRGLLGPPLVAIPNHSHTRGDLMIPDGSNVACTVHQRCHTLVRTGRVDRGELTMTFASDDAYVGWELSESLRNGERHCV
jgi:hypothetical protein